MSSQAAGATGYLVQQDSEYEYRASAQAGVSKMLAVDQVLPGGYTFVSPSMHGKTTAILDLLWRGEKHTTVCILSVIR